MARLLLNLVPTLTLLTASCLSGSTEPPDRARRTDAGTVKVSSFEMGSIVLGQCADFRGHLKRGICSARGRSLSAADLAIKSDLMAGKDLFNYYAEVLSVQSDVDAKAAFSGATFKGKSKLTVSRHRIIYEWSRTRSIPLVFDEQESPGPLVSSIDVGFAIRLVFDVTLASSNTEAATSFGPSEVAAAIATNRAKVSIRMDTVGISSSLVPEDLPTSVTSVDQFADVMSKFIKAIENVRDEYNDYKGVIGKNDGSTHTFNHLSRELGVISYQVSNIPAGMYDLFQHESTEYEAQWKMLGYEAGILAIAEAAICDVRFPLFRGMDAGHRAFAEGGRLAYSHRVGRCDTSKAPELPFVLEAKTFLPRGTAADEAQQPTPTIEPAPIEPIEPGGG